MEISLTFSRSNQDKTLILFIVLEDAVEVVAVKEVDVGTEVVTDGEIEAEVGTGVGTKIDAVGIETVEIAEIDGGKEAETDTELEVEAGIEAENAGEVVKEMAADKKVAKEAEIEVGIEVESAVKIEVETVAEKEVETKKIQKKIK